MQLKTLITPGTACQISSEGILHFYDPVRLKDLSAGRFTFDFGINHLRARGKRYLCSSDNLPSNVSPILVTRNAIITAIYAKADTITTGSIQIQKVGGADVHTIELTAENYRFEDNLDIDLIAGDQIQTFIKLGIWDYPNLQIELAWKF